MPDVQKCCYCGTLLPKDAKYCPSCRKKQPWAKKFGKNILIGLGVLVAGGAIGNLVPHVEPPPPPTPEAIAKQESEKQEFKDSIDAQVAARLYVEQRLKSPSSAKWQNSADVEVGRLKGSKNKLLVHGYVDSANSFGAVLRMQYWATTAKGPDGEWRVVKLKTDQ